MKPKVLVLLATCNGEKYLRQQLDSIYAQEDVEVSIFATDDGSTDNTNNIGNIHFAITVHIGPVKGKNIISFAQDMVYDTYDIANIYKIVAVHITN